MADSGIKDFNLHIIIANRMACKLIIVKMSVLGMEGKALCRNTVVTLLCLTCCYCQQQAGNQ